jgi:hypothetical protein
MKNPIGKREREYLKGAEVRLQEGVTLLTQCKRCGIDVAEAEQAALALAEQIEALKREFVGVQPPRVTDDS